MRGILERDTQVGHETQDDTSPSPSDYGSFRTSEAGVNYVSSSHWAAVLDSITDLRDHITQDDEAYPKVLDPAPPSTSFPKPQLLYSCALHESSASILSSLPPRPIVDRATAIVKYQLNLLVFQQSFSDTDALFSPEASGHKSQTRDSPALIEIYKAKAIQCLLLGHYTNGGPHVLETLILYFLIENFYLKDMEIGIWVLVGQIVQIAIHMGYHRDAKHFSSISPFDAEMRRRVWAMIVQLDSSVSTQLGLPRLVKESDTNTAEPRNLLDSDFDEDTSILPPSKPETDVTPTLYALAKLRLLPVGASVAEIAMEPHSHPYTEILNIDKRIDEARDKIPSSLKWTGLASSLNVPSQTMIQRIWLEVIIQELKIVLHRKFLEPARLDVQHDYSRLTCLDAAMRILELQHLVDEETQIGGLLYQSRWRVSSAFINDFLLATSVLCLYVQTHHKKQGTTCGNSGVSEAGPEMDRMKDLLRKSQVIWNRQSASSKEARKAVIALDYVLGDTLARIERSAKELSSAAVPTTSVSYFPDYPDFISNCDLTWPISPTNLNDVDQWLGGTDFQDVDMTS
ncbi:fungal specific transcription factor domain protein [Penicillium malachiteum]|uniref:fungal specific transcription factor domain protein n=1 Tax=Penicillium malachiteum TaxID=1324776 RepID=UPI002549768E|nr:fungal specific transcription factor domain protein [Penicillium malachiteum]KAJ5713463.1 fungal specific transcription factor domain protein [Penicillium malachiteum]